MLSSQGLFFATAMAVSAGTIILFDLFKDKYFSSSQNQDSEKQVLKSCLSKSSGNKKREKEQRKKRVHFADDVRDFRGSERKFCRKGQKNAEITKSSCVNEVGFKKMPANRAVLYSGILKDRLQRMEYSC